MEVRSLKTEGIPATGYMTAQEAQPDMSDYLMHCLDSSAPIHQRAGARSDRAKT
jgi:hypothetical protein